MKGKGLFTLSLLLFAFLAGAATVDVTAGNFGSCRTLVNGNTYRFAENVTFAANAGESAMTVAGGTGRVTGLLYFPNGDHEFAVNGRRYVAAVNDADTTATLQGIPYRAWNEETRQMEDRVCTDCTFVTAQTKVFEDGKWYVVRDQVSRGKIDMKGSARLILCDGATLTVTGGEYEPGVEVRNVNALHIYGQVGGTGTLVVTGGLKGAGIGGGDGGAGGTVTIDGGRVTVTGGAYAAGIGGGWRGDGGTVAVNGGTVTVQGGLYAAGIGGSWQGDVAGTVTINGGRVTATGGEHGAGIGGGWNGADGGRVTVNGGRVTATGSQYAAGIGGGWLCPGGTVTVNGGTVTATGGDRTSDIGSGWAVWDDNGTLTIDGGSVKAQTVKDLAKNSADASLYRVTVKCTGLEDLVSLGGLEGYGTNDIFAVDGCVYLWLPDGTHRFALSDGEKTQRYCAIVNGRDVTVQPLKLGFFVNGTSVEDGSGTGWIYDENDVLLLNGNGPFVLSGEATNNEVQVKVAHQGATVVLSNAVVFASGRSALDVAQTAALLMTGGESYLVSTNESAAVSVAEGVTLAVGLAPDANRLETAVGVFNFGAAAGIAGKGVVRVDGGTFCVWADVTGLETPNGVTCGADEIMMTGKTPEEARYAAESGTEPCILVAPAVAVTVKDIPHVTGFTVSNAVEAIEGTAVTGGTSCRVMLGDDVFVGYTLEAGYVSRAANPLVYAAIEGDVTIDANTIPTLQGIPYRAWNEETRRMEDRVCTDYEIVTPGTQAFEDGKWYVVRDPVERGRIEVNGVAHLILCDGAKLTAKGGAKEAGIAVVEGRSLSIYGQTLGTGELAATGDTYWAARCVGGAGIGGDGDTSCGSVTINGGVITAKAMGYAAGIGGGTNGKGGMVTINGGLVNANGGPYAAGIGGGNGNGGEGGTVTINGGTVRATHSYTASDIGDAIANRAGATVTINGGSVKAETIRNAPSNGVERVFCVTVKCTGFQSFKVSEFQGFKVEGLDDYGTNDIHPIDGCVYLWLPNGTHRFTVSDGEKTLRYCAVVKGKGVTVEPLGPVGFFVNGTDVTEGSGTGWTYGMDGVLSLNAEMTFVLTGEATNNQVQVKAAHQGATVVLSNAVVFTEGRSALDVTEGVRLLMTGGESYLVATNESAAITVAQNAEIKVDRESYANSREAMIGVFNFGDAATIDGAGSVSVNDGTFFVWGDNRAIVLPEFRVSGPELMKAGDAPEEMKYTTTDWASKKCVLVGPAVTVTVRTDIPHVTGFTASNAVEVLQELTIWNAKVYRVMRGDDVFVGYAVEEGYISRTANPLAYAAIEGDVTVDANTIPVVQTIPYRAWNEETRRMEDRVCTDYEIVTASTQAFEDGKWYVVLDPVARGTIAVGGVAHLILCDGATLTVTGADQPGILLDYGKSLTVCGQSGGSGTLKANGGTNSAGIGSGSRMSATAGELTVDGGIVLATGQGLAAGIGGSDNNLSTIGWKGYGNGGKVTINGGRVTATPGYGGSMGNPAAIGGGSNGTGGDVVIRGGTVNAIARNGTGIGMGTNRRDGRYTTLTVDGGSIKAQTAAGLAKNAAGAPLYCVTVKCEEFQSSKVSKLQGLKVEGLGDYGTNDIYAVEGAVYLWLPDGTHRFKLSDGEKTLHYCAIVNGRDVTIEPLAAVGFFVNGADVNDGSGTGWTYGEGNVLSLNAEMTYVLSGEATNNEVQVRVAHQGATVVLSNAVVFASGRSALDVAQTAALQMTGGESYLVSTNESAAVSVAEGVTLAVGLAPDANRLESAVGVFNYGAAPGIAGKGAVRAEGGTFCVWADVTGLETPNGVTCGEGEIMMAGKTPEEARYATECGTEPCILVAPAVTVTVKDGIPHASGFSVSNAVEEIQGFIRIADGTVYRVMLGDDVFVGYTLEAGYVSQAANPLAYAAIEGDVTVDANTIPTLQSIPYRAWNEETRQMEDCVCTNYTFVTADTEAFEDGKWYVVLDPVERGTIAVSGAAHLILCDEARLTAEAVTNGTLAVYGQTENTGSLVATGTVDAVLTVVGGNVKAESVTKQAKNAMGQDVHCVIAKVEKLKGFKVEGFQGFKVEGLEGYGIEKAGLIDGRVYLWLPDGTHRFAISDGQTTRFYYAKVDGGNITVDPLEPLGFRVNGVDVFEGTGTGWSYDGDVLTLDRAMTYVLSGAATNNEVQVKVAHQGATAVLSNAVVFASGRPAVVATQGAALMTPVDEVMKAGETPETLKYTTTCGAAPCVVAGPAVTVTVKVGIPHATDFTVSNAVEAIRGFTVVDGTAYRVMLGEDVFVGYAVEEWYYSHSANPLAYAAIEGDVTVDAGSVRILPIIPYRAWNETTRQTEDRACTNYTFVAADTATFEDGRWYVATGAVERGSISVDGAAHLILCDGARLTAEAITNGTLAVYGQPAGCGELVVSNDVASSLSVQGGRLSAGALSGDSLAIVGGTLAADAVGNGRTTIDGGSVKVGPDGSVRVKAGLTNFVNRAGQPLHCVTVKCAGFQSLKVSEFQGFKVEGLDDYGTNDIYPIEGCVYLWLPNGTHRFTLSDGEKTQRYCAVVNGRDVTVEPLGSFGFFVNGTDVTEGSGTGWTYDVHGVLTLGAGLAQDTEMTYVLSGEATNDEVQVKVAQTDATVVVSNAVVMAAGRPALVVERTVALRMAGGASYFVSTNESAAISVEQNAEIRVNGMRGEDGLDPTVGVCNSGSAAAISGGGTVRVDGGTFFVWADVTGPETPNGVIAGAGRAMKVGKTPETLRYATSSGTEPCILIAQAVIVTVKNGIPHASGFTVSNAVEEVGSMDVPDGKVYRVMTGDDIFIGYALEEGYVSPAANPLVYRAINGDVTVDASTIAVRKDEPQPVAGVFDAGGTLIGSYLTVTGALASVTNGCTVRLFADIAEPLDLETECDLFLDDNGHSAKVRLFVYGGCATLSRGFVTDVITLDSGSDTRSPACIRLADPVPSGDVFISVLNAGWREGTPIIRGNSVAARNVRVCQPGYAAFARGGNIVLDTIWSEPFVAVTVDEAAGLTNFMSFATFAEAIKTCDTVGLLDYVNDVLLFETNAVAADISVPMGRTVTLCSVLRRSETGTNTVWGLETAQPVVFSGHAEVFGTLALADVRMDGELTLHRNATLDLGGSYALTNGHLYVTVAEPVVMKGAVLVTSGYWSAAELKRYCRVTNPGWTFVPVDGRGLVLAEVSDWVARLGAGYFPAVEDAFAAAVDGDVVELISTTNTDTHAVSDAVAPKSRTLAIRSPGVVRVGSARRVTTGSEARWENPPAIPTVFDLDGIELHLALGSELSLGNVQVSGKVSLSGDGLLVVSNYTGRGRISVRIADAGEVAARRPIAVGSADRLELVDTVGELVQSGDYVYWQYDIFTYKYEQRGNGTAYVTVNDGGKVKELDPIVSETGTVKYKYVRENGEERELLLHLICIDYENAVVHVPTDVETKFMSKDGNWRTVRDGDEITLDWQVDSDGNLTFLFNGQMRKVKGLSSKPIPSEDFPDAIKRQAEADEKNGGSHIGGIIGGILGTATVGGILGGLAVAVGGGAGAGAAGGAAGGAAAMPAALGPAGLAALFGGQPPEPGNLSDLDIDDGPEPGDVEPELPQKPDSETMKLWEKRWEAFHKYVSYFFDGVTVVQAIKDAVVLFACPIEYKGIPRFKTAFEKVHRAAQTENNPDYAIHWFFSSSIHSAELLGQGSVDIEADRSLADLILAELQAGSLPKGSDFERFQDAFNWVMRLDGIFTALAKKKVSGISLAGEVVSLLKNIIQLGRKNGYFDPPVNASVVIPSGGNYSVSGMRFGIKEGAPARPRTAPIIEVMGGATLRLSECDFANYTYSNRVGLIHVRSGGVLSLESTTFTNNVSQLDGTAPVVVDAGGIVWLYGKTSVDNLSVTGGDVRIGKGPYRGGDPKSGDLSGRVNIGGDTRFSDRLGTVAFDKSKGWDNIHSLSRDFWYMPVINENAVYWGYRPGRQSLLQPRFAAPGLSIKLEEKSDGRHVNLSGLITNAWNTFYYTPVGATSPKGPFKPVSTSVRQTKDSQYKLSVDVPVGDSPSGFFNVKLSDVPLE